MASKSEAEGQELGVTSGVTIDQRTEADLMGNTGTGQAFGNDADDDAQHGGAPVEQLNPLELVAVSLLGGAAFEPFVVDWSVGHGWAQMKRLAGISVNSMTDR